MLCSLILSIMLRGKLSAVFKFWLRTYIYLDLPEITRVSWLFHSCVLVNTALYLLTVLYSRIERIILCRALTHSESETVVQVLVLGCGVYWPAITNPLGAIDPLLSIAPVETWHICINSSRSSSASMFRLESEWTTGRFCEPGVAGRVLKVSGLSWLSPSIWHSKITASISPPHWLQAACCACHLLRPLFSSCALTSKISSPCLNVVKIYTFCWVSRWKTR